MPPNNKDDDPPSPWRTSRAKVLLMADLREGNLKDKTPKEIHQLRPQYKKYPYKQFAPNLKRLLDNPQGAERPPSPWKNSRAKAMLAADIEDGLVDDESDLKEVYRMHPEYSRYREERFCDNFKNLYAEIMEDLDYASLDAQRFEEDKEFYGQTTNGRARWDGSAAQDLLKKDIDDGMLELHPPQYLWAMRPEYCNYFTKKQFRDHITQEYRSRAYSSYWLSVKANKQAKIDKQRAQRDEFFMDVDTLLRKYEDADTQDN